MVILSFAATRGHSCHEPILSPTNSDNSPNIRTMTPTLLHAGALAIRLATNYEQARELIESGQLPTIQLPNGQLRVDPRDVEEWIQQAKNHQAN